MAQSMTAYARVEIQESWGTAAWEIRSVNHRYLDISMRLPESFKKWEIKWRDTLKRYIGRGKVECILTYKATQGIRTDLQIDTHLVDQLVALNRQIGNHAELDSQITTMDLMKWPEVIIAQQQEMDLDKPISELLEQAIIQLIDYRGREGQACIEVIQEKIEYMESEIAIIQPLLPEMIEQYREKLKSRLQTLKTEIDANRFEQEVVLFLQRVDVAEELDRLQIHLDEVKRVIHQSGSIGRRLDFLMQELNREANTLASKSAHPRLTQAAVELKVYIEQVREQIQNME